VFLSFLLKKCPVYCILFFFTCFISYISTSS